jgi:hypothetical protein
MALAQNLFSGNGERTGPPWSRIWGLTWSALRLLQVRLRVPLVLVIAALVVGRWDVLRNYWDRLTRPRTAETIAHQAVSSDIEYFCPMDPAVVSNWPNKCGICNMTLVQRKKGEATMLPDGVIARMQLSPYRVQLAGVLTGPVEFQSLTRQIRGAGPVRLDGGKALCEALVPARQAPWIQAKQAVEVRCRELIAQRRLGGHVTRVDRVEDEGWEALRCVVEIDDPRRSLRSGMIAELTFQVSLAELDPFRALPEAPTGRKSGEFIEIFACSDHPEVVSDRVGRCPRDGNRLMLRTLADYEGVRWWCPMHPQVTAEAPGKVCRECGGMALRPRVVAFRPRGKVLAVPESAVVDSGTRTVVFVEGMPGMFDGVEVELGPRCGDFFPVLHGLEAGQRIAIKGAFLLDAETRLNPSLAATYFGASRDQAASKASAAPIAGPAPSKTDHQHTPDAQGDGSDSPKIRAALAGLPEADRILAERQRTCPVTRMPLGSMGTPRRVEVQGRVVFLCCDGCTEKLRRNADRYLAGLPDSKAP